MSEQPGQLDPADSRSIGVPTISEARGELPSDDGGRESEASYPRSNTGGQRRLAMPSHEYFGIKQ